MSAAHVPMEIDQGEDWTCQVIYTDDSERPYKIVHPCQMDIKNKAGATQVSLSTPDTVTPDGVIPEIAVSNEVGLIQLHIEDSVTKALVPGLYSYDLFVTVNDGSAYAGNQRQRLIYGEVLVNKRVTDM